MDSIERLQRRRLDKLLSASEDERTHNDEFPVGTIFPKAGQDDVKVTIGQVT
jgi:hypothetical protein